ncbi:MAG: nucleotide sugar dehydrogenase [Chitinophagales bacterium]|nr:nucleotide sugar dehydrogenase [Chitinophagales bacterium]MDW8419120.1 nucleotide sugar dehydrogenase [Chitinophagales bacterium]
MVEDLLSKKKKLAVIGLGYVGLPIALEFARKISVIGFDINRKRIELMKQKIDPSNELEPHEFEGTDILFTADIDDLRQASFYIVAVPTPVDKHNVPDLKPILSASETIGKVLKKGDYVVFESTVYPGCTEEDCLPVIERVSGLSLKNGDFKLGYSPERINPGDKEHTITKITKVVSGSDAEALDVIARTYEIIVKAGTHRASSIKVAEAAKIIENTQRDLNIALMNELSRIFDLMGINTYEVLEAAGTKWNFLKFYPGLVGGHCIGVDPYYLTYKANALGYNPEVILAGRRINDDMGAHVARKLVQQLIKLHKQIDNTRVLVMGATFKENVSDIRNSKVVDVIEELKRYSVNVEVVDPLADAEEFHEEYGIQLNKEYGTDYDAVIVAVNHEQFSDLDDDFFSKVLKEDGIVVDVKGELRKRVKKFRYWSL